MFKQFSAVLVATIVLAGAGFAQAGTTFNLGGYGGSDSSYDFSKDGIDLDITASWEDGPNSGNAWAHQWSGGMGVKNAWNDNTSELDGSGRADILWFSFSETINVLTAHFTGIGYFSDQVRFIDENGDIIGDADLSPGNYLGSATLDFSDLAFDLIGSTFGITVTDSTDSFRVCSVEVETAATSAPTPAAATAGMMMFGLLALRRRKRNLA